VLKLGIVYKGEYIINHRCLLKIVLNPCLAPFGCVLGSLFVDDEFISYRFGRCDKQKFWKRLKEAFVYKGEYDYIVKRKILF
jgi:hypothetical protein